MSIPDLSVEKFIEKNKIKSVVLKDLSIEEWRYLMNCILDISENNKDEKIWRAMSREEFKTNKNINCWFNVPSKKIPLKLSKAKPIEKFIYLFRLEKGY